MKRVSTDYRKKIEELQHVLEERRLVVNNLRQKIQAQTFKQMTSNLNVTKPAAQIVSDAETMDEQQDLLPHIKKIIAADVLFSGIDFTVKQKETINGEEKYLLNAVVGSVEFILWFKWNKTTNTVSNSHIDVSDPMQKMELASRTNQCIRENDLQKLTRIIREYAELYDAREKALEHLSQKYRSHFQYTQETDAEGYKIQISNRLSDLQFLSAQWTIKWYKARFCMDHSFSIEVFKEAEELGKEQTKYLQTLVKEENASESQIIKMFTNLILAFEDWKSNNPDLE